MWNTSSEIAIESPNYYKKKIKGKKHKKSYIAYACKFFEKNIKFRRYLVFMSYFEILSLGN